MTAPRAASAPAPTSWWAGNDEAHTEAHRPVSGFRRGMPLHEFRRLMEERPNPRPCVHPYQPSGLAIRTRYDRTGMHIAVDYQCPDCQELITGAEWPLRKVMNR